VWRNRRARSASGSLHGDVLVEEALERDLAAAIAGEEARQTLELFGPPETVLELHVQPVDGGGAVATIVDVTERARLDAVRTDFVANISHELKTPIGALSLLAETLTDADDPDVSARLSGKIVKEAERLTRTIDDLLELSQIELRGGMESESMSATAVIVEAVERVRPLAERRQVELVIESPAVPLSVVGDRRQLVSAVGNLLDNAVKYSDAGSTVEVSASTDGERVVFAVSDHGMGIAAQHLDRIFERFYRVDRARSRDKGGVGLGLAIVRHVAANHGGEVTVTSLEGEGSTFRLLIPAAPAWLDPKPAVPPEPRG
jgi:two-component system sensor histidine kinase SenX3